MLPNIKIVEAKYGLVKFKDVTDIIKEEINKGNYKITPSAHLFDCVGQEKDPAWGNDKIFILKYILGGVEKTIKVKDNKEISLY